MAVAKKKPIKAGKRSKKKGSLRPYTRHSTMATNNTVAAAAGVQIFNKVTVAQQIGNQATEGDLFRRITNTHATLAVSVGETQAQAVGATAYKLLAGQSLDLLGREVGWAGDVWIAESTSAASISQMSF